MKPKNSGSGRRIVCLVLVAVMLLGLISSALIIMVNAASSSEIKKELNGLRSQQAELKKEREALQAKIKENQSKTQTLVEKKSDIDQQISMTQASIDNLNEQVQQYSLLIANKQADLEASQAEEQRLNTQYKTRIRSMEETGSISYWAILFGANSFSDLLDKIDVIQEIAKADQQMLKKMKAVSEQIAAERAELEQQMAELDATRQELDQQEQDLEAQRAEQDTLLTEMLAAYEEMNADYMQNMADEAALSEEIAKSESAYYAALSKEEAERIAVKWMKAVTESFKTTGNLWEKYNVETGTTDVSNEYEMPAMLGWTAGTFICLDDYLAGEMQPDPLPSEYMSY